MFKMNVAHLSLQPRAFIFFPAFVLTQIKPCRKQAPCPCLVVSSKGSALRGSPWVHGHPLSSFHDVLGTLAVMTLYSPVCVPVAASLLQLGGSWVCVGRGTSVLDSDRWKK